MEFIAPRSQLLTLKAQRRKSKLWFNEECYTTKKAFDRFKYSIDLQKLASLKRTYGKICTAALSRWHSKHQQVFLDNVIRDRNFLWKIVKFKRGRQPPLKLTADAWKYHFKNLYQIKPGDDNILITEPHGNYDYLAFQANPITSYNWRITQNEVCDAIS